MKKIWGFFKKYFITGLLVILPVWATYYVLTALLGVIDGLRGDLMSVEQGMKFIISLGLVPLSELQANKLKQQAQELR